MTRGTSSILASSLGAERPALRSYALTITIAGVARSRDELCASTPLVGQVSVLREIAR
jgi:hypothetical protein